MPAFPAHIIGTGLVTALGRGLPAHVAALRAGTVRPMPSPVTFQGQVLPYHFASAARGEPAAFLAMIDAAVGDALAQAALPAEAQARMGVFVGSTSLDLPLLEAVVICDSALRAGDITVDELVSAAGGLAGVRDARRVRLVLELCDPASGSVLESVLRVRMVLAGIVGFVSQRVLRDLPGQHLRVDFAFVGAGLVVEVDGARWHQDPERDQERDNALAVLGWRVLRFTWSDVVHDTDRVLQDIRDALACGRPSFHLRAVDTQEAA